MKFLLWNISGDFLSIAQRLEKEGYQTYSYYQTPSLVKGRRAGEGIIPLISNPYSVLAKESKNDLIILVDDNGYGDNFEYLKKEGWKIIGASKIGDLIEYDRSFGMEVFEKVGIPIPKTIEFDDVYDAISFLKEEKEDTRFLVFKGEGVDFAGSSYSFVAHSKEHMIIYLNDILDKIEKNVIRLEKFILQEKIEGIEVSVAAYFNGERFIDDYLFLDFEEKKIGAYNTGHAVGCMGQVIHILPAKGNFYFENYLKKLEPVLQEYGYVGEWDFNNIYDPITEKFYALEHCPRFGWDSTIGEFALKKEGKEIGEFFIKLVNKEPIKNFFYINDKISLTWRLYVNSPDSEAKDIYGTIVWYNEELENNFWHYAVSKKDNILIATDNPFSCFTVIQDTFSYDINASDVLQSEKVLVNNLYYRKDIATRFPDALQVLPFYK